MEQRFLLRKKQLLEDAELKSELSEGTVGGLLSDVEKKNIESIAYHYDPDRRAFQRFIGISPWNFTPLEKELVPQVGQYLAPDDGVIVSDPSGHRKYGRESVGLQRQCIGRSGKIENGQVGIYMGHETRCDHALAATRVYLSKEWVQDLQRCKKWTIPQEVRFQTRHEFALAMLQEHGPRLPHRWVTGDGEMGRCTSFRRQLGVLLQNYRLAIPSNIHICDLEASSPSHQSPGVPPPKVPFQRVDIRVDTLSDTHWKRVDVRDGEKAL